MFCVFCLYFTHRLRALWVISKFVCLALKWPNSVLALAWLTDCLESGHKIGQKISTNSSQKGGGTGGEGGGNMGYKKLKKINNVLKFKWANHEPEYDYVDRTL